MDNVKLGIISFSPFSPIMPDNNIIKSTLPFKKLDLIRALEALN